MGRFLPTRSETMITQSGEPTVVFFDDERAEAILTAVQSNTARKVLQVLIREPMPPSEIASVLDMSVENVSYHLDNMQEHQLIEEYDTVYSEKGREMTVYGITEEPLVMIFGSNENDDQLLATFSRLAAAVGPVGILIAVKESLSNSLEIFDLV